MMVVMAYVKVPKRKNRRLLNKRLVAIVIFRDLKPEKLGVVRRLGHQVEVLHDHLLSGPSQTVGYHYSVCHLNWSWSCSISFST